MADYEFYADCLECAPPPDVLAGIVACVVSGTAAIAGLILLFDARRNDTLWFGMAVISLVWISLCAMQALFLVGQLAPDGLGKIYLDSPNLAVCITGILLSAVSAFVVSSPPPTCPRRRGEAAPDGYEPVPEQVKPNHV